MSEQENNIKKESEFINEDVSPSTFDSAFYFDDIIKELSEAGFYADDQPVLPKNQTLKTVSHNTPATVSSEVETKKEMLDRISSLENNLSNDFNHLNSKVKNLKDLIIRQKTETAAIQKELLEKFMLVKNDNDENFSRMQASFNQKVATDVTKDKAFEKLYEQMDAYKKNFVKSAIKPFISDLILLHDRLDNNLLSISGEENQKFKEIMQMFKDELLEIFSRNSISPLIKSDPGDKFNAEKSNAIKKVETDDFTKDNLICEVLQEGFIYDEKVFRPELVSIYKFKAAEEEKC